MECARVLETLADALLLRLGTRQSARQEAAIILAHVLGVDRSVFIAYPERRVAPAKAALAQQLCLRRGQGEPLAYVLGFREFFGRRFQVDKSVLVPRPETEELVELALREVLAAGAAVLDLACGSGCIGLTIALERPAARVVLADVSLEALAVTERNRAALFPEPDSGRTLSEAQWPVPIVVRSDWFASVPPIRYNLIVSNPPYIHPDETAALESDVVDFEPGLALFHSDPVGLMATLLDDARSLLVPGGRFLFETAPRWVEATLDRAESLGYEAEALLDLSGRPRFLRARRAD